MVRGGEVRGVRGVWRGDARRVAVWRGGARCVPFPLARWREGQEDDQALYLETQGVARCAGVARCGGVWRGVRCAVCGVVRGWCGWCEGGARYGCGEVDSLPFPFPLARGRADTWRRPGPVFLKRLKLTGMGIAGWWRGVLCCEVVRGWCGVLRGCGKGVARCGDVWRGGARWCEVRSLSLGKVEGKARRRPGPVFRDSNSQGWGWRVARW